MTTKQQVGEELFRYQLELEYSYRSKHLEGVALTNTCCKIVDGVLTVYPGYLWDGCTPTWYLPVVGWSGAPDGQENPITGKPQAYYASMVHDVLCAFRADIKITKAATIAIFKAMLIDGGFPSWRAELYARMVNLFGPQDWLGDPPVSQASPYIG